MHYLQIPAKSLRVIIGVIGGLMVVTRLYGVMYPERVKKTAEKIASWRLGWIRFLYVIVSLIGLWVLYSTLVIIFSSIPVYMVFSFLLGLLFIVAGIFISHPEWLPDFLNGVLVHRGNFFVRVLCFIGVLFGIAMLLSAILGWGGN